MTGREAMPETAPDVAMRRFLTQAAETFARHDSAIGRTLAGALAEITPRDLAPPTRAETVPEPRLDTATEPACSLAACLPFLHWRRSGFGRLPDGLSKNIHAAEIVGPHGMIPHAHIRFGVLHQNAAQRYPEHRHAAEELYFILAGQALWSIDKNAPSTQEAGCFVHHRPWQWHAMETLAGPLLALWGWTGQIDADTYGLE